MNEPIHYRCGLNCGQTWSVTEAEALMDECRCGGGCVPVTLSDLLDSTDRISPGTCDKLRVVAKRRLGWLEPYTMEFFWALKDKANAGQLTKGFFLSHVRMVRNAEGAKHPLRVTTLGDVEALVFARALYEFANPGKRKKQIRDEVKAKYKG